MAEKIRPSPYSICPEDKPNKGTISFCWFSACSMGVIHHLKMYTFGGHLECVLRPPLVNPKIVDPIKKYPADTNGFKASVIIIFWDKHLKSTKNLKTLTDTPIRTFARLLVSLIGSSTVCVMKLLPGDNFWRAPYSDNLQLCLGGDLILQINALHWKKRI